MQVSTVAAARMTTISSLLVASDFLASTVLPRLKRSRFTTVAMPSERPAPVPTEAMNSAPSMMPPRSVGMPEYSKMYFVRATFAEMSGSTLRM